MSKESRYSLRASNEFIYQWLVIILIFNLIIFLIIHYIISPLLEKLGNPELYSKIVWAIFVFVMFSLFAITYIIINGPRYWIDNEYLEIWFIYRPRKRRFVYYKDIKEVRIRRPPIIGSAFNYGTIILYKTNQHEKLKVYVRIIGIKFPNEISHDLLKRCNIKKEKEEIKKDLFL